MTQTFFATGENNPTIHTKLNQAVQGHRFRHRATFVGRTERVIFNFDYRTSAVHVRMVGGGGGGGGAQQPATGPPGLGATLANAAVGGGAGAYYEFFLTDSTLLGNTFYIDAPPGGQGGLPNGPGQNGGNAEIAYDRRVGSLVARTTLAFAGGGQGGAAMASGSSFTVLTVGGLGGLTLNYNVTPGDIYMNGEKGGYAIRHTTTLVYAGRGGQSVFKGGGMGASTRRGNGGHADAIGGGGGGACVDNNEITKEDYVGGNGGNAAVFIDEYY